MPNALVVLVVLALLVAAYWIGGAIATHRLEGEFSEQRERDRERWRSDRDRDVRVTRRWAYERAAEAVAMWDGRIDRRPALMAHLKSLGDPCVMVIPGGAWDDASQPPGAIEAVPLPPGVSSTTVSTPEHEAEITHVESYRQEGLL